jgi:hypothetical protein
MFNIAQQFGFTKESFEAALKDPQTQVAQLTALRDQAIKDFKLEGTPTFYINGKQLTGEHTVADLAAEIDPLVPADFKPTQAGPETPASTPATTTTESGAATPVAPDATATTTTAPVTATTTTTTAPMAPAATTTTAAP